MEGLDQAEVQVLVDIAPSNTNIKINPSIHINKVSSAYLIAKSQQAEINLCPRASENVLRHQLMDQLDRNPRCRKKPAKYKCPRTSKSLSNIKVLLGNRCPENNVRKVRKPTSILALRGARSGDERLY